MVAVKRLKVDTGAVHPVSGVEQMDQLSICSTRLATLRTRRIVNTIRLPVCLQPMSLAAENAAENAVENAAENAADVKELADCARKSARMVSLA